jgi:anti-sigma B factor antagonist
MSEQPDAGQMAISVIPAGDDAVVVTVNGEVDLLTARQLMDALEGVWKDRPDVKTVVIDLAGVSFLGSSGLGILADLAGRTTTRTPGVLGPAVRLVAPPENDAVIRPWTTMNLQQILPLHPDVNAALSAS